MDDIQRIIGTAFIDTYGDYCLKVVKAGYKLDELYDPGAAWGDFSLVLLATAVVSGVKSYKEYTNWLRVQPVTGQSTVTIQKFSRFTGIKSPKVRTNQSAYNERYRLRTLAELEALRQSTALKWIDNHLDLATEYIKTKKKS